MKASDGLAAHDQTDTVTINLINENDNAPVLTIDNDPVSLSETASAGAIAGADADATDADGDTVTFSLVGAPVDGSSNPLFSIDSSTGALTQVPGVPRPFNAGYYSLVVGLNRSGTVLYEYGWGSTTDLHSFAIGAGGTLTEIPNTRVPRAGWALGMALSR